MTSYTPPLAPVFESHKFFQLGGARFLALNHSTPVSSLATVFRLGASDIPTSGWIEQQISTWLETDDIFEPRFMAGAVFVTEGNHRDLNLSTSIESLPQHLKPNWWVSLTSHSSDELQPGPRIVSNGNLFTVSRVHDDVHGAFMVATMPRASPGPFANLHASGKFYTSLGVAVPSRIPGIHAKDKPLGGVRFAVKDVFEIEGLRVTAGDRSFYSLSKPSDATCPAIKRLIDSGAQLLGTLKLGSLIAKEEPTESVDFHAPFNPRADGYQSAWSSSGGSGAAIAAYEWLDFTLGTDTTGSGRRPAMANGAFQLRLTHDAIPLTNVVPSFPRFDSPAMYTRSIDSLEKYVGVWLGQDNTTYDDNQLPLAIIYLTDFLPLQNEKQMKLIDAFFTDADAATGVKTEKISLADNWKASPPEGATDISIHDYLKDVGVNTFVYDVYHTMANFREEYQKKFDRNPYINPNTRFRWLVKFPISFWISTNRKKRELAKEISTEEHEEGMRRLEVYKGWFLEHILQTEKRNALVILPITSQEVDYKETPPPSVTSESEISSLFLTNMQTSSRSECVRWNLACTIDGIT
ncbi:hypothetical protein N7456_002836 [Penicillium angulare]|uniref:Amidase domain-containing protein n=1 Tax=Penicillium angulare TaxID=116970 RepID=A0A9W9FTI1_9EURO|nr:hypothetical protein N7456_002836 [Penicillium angulare]